MKSAKRLAPGTRGRYSVPMEETWADVPDLRGVEVSTSGRVRRWMTLDGKPRPQPYPGRAANGTVEYRLDDRTWTIDELMLAAFGDEAEELEAIYDPGERDRDLSQYERSEIVLLEGIKPAYEVADEFRIDPGRVRNIWDGAE